MTASSAKDLLMRYTPAALALSLLVAVTSSASFSAPPRPLDPRAQILLAQGRAELAAGRLNDAVDAYNRAIGQFPALIVAWAFRLRRASPLV